MVAVVKKNVQDVTKPIQKDIMKDRTETDKYWFYLFVIILLIWLGACTYLCCNKNKLEPYDGNSFLCSQNGTNDGEDFITRSIINLARLEENTRRIGPITVFANLLIYSGLLIFATSAIFLKVYHTYCGHCFIICTGMQIVSIGYRGVMFFDGSSAIVPWKNEFLCWDIPDLVAFFICVTLILVVGIRKGMHVTANNFIKAIRFYSFHMSTLLFGLVVLIMMGCLIYNTFETIKGVDTKNISVALPIIVLLGSSYLLLLHYYFAVAVISLTTANSYWKQDEKKISCKDVARAVVVVYKYHFGTICFNATGILPLIVAIAALIESLIQSIRTRSGFAKKYIMMAFFFFVGEYSTMITAMNGKNFIDATDRFLHLPIEARRVAKNLRENQMIWMIISLIMISVNNLMLVLKFMYYEDDPYFTQAAILSYATIIYLFMPVALIVDVVMDTILFCEVEKSEAINSSASNDLPTNVLVELPTDEVTVAK